MSFPSRAVFSQCVQSIARSGRWPFLLVLPVIFILAACGQQGSLPYSESGPSAIGAVPQQYYPPPGPPEDPWGPYIHEAAARFNVPEQWIRAVMQEESGGEEQAVSPVGAMGLMQVMPETYEELRVTYGLGADPFNPHDNILAGAAYIHEMYDEFGSPGFLAGYNAGPDRVESYLAGTARLPHETRHYIAAIAPYLGDAIPPSGPLANYAAAGSAGVFKGRMSVASLAAGCDLDAAYDPSHPCTSLEEAATTSSPQQVAFAETGANGCDLDVAYDPNHPCTSLPQAAAGPAPVEAPARQSPVEQAALTGCDADTAYYPDHPCRPTATAPPVRLAMNEYCDPNAAYDPDHPCRPTGEARVPRLQLPRSAVSRRDRAEPSAAIVSSAHHRPAPRNMAEPAARDWAIQIGAFKNPRLARAVAEGARRQARGQLRTAALTLPSTPFRGAVLYRARLAHLSEREAAAACTQLNRRQLPCIVVRPSRT
jgi:D-alanyl-D-alanine carboxypeptidase